MIFQDPKGLIQQSPFARWAYVDVKFVAADTDTGIPHPFAVADPETIRYMTMAIDGDAYVYRAALGTRKAFDSSLIWLRASAACTARLLLSVESS